MAQAKFQATPTCKDRRRQAYARPPGVPLGRTYLVVEFFILCVLGRQSEFPSNDVTGDLDAYLTQLRSDAEGSTCGRAGAEPPAAGAGRLHPPARRRHLQHPAARAALLAQD